MKTIQCKYCGKMSGAIRKTKKFCSDTCARRQRIGYPRTRNCKLCSKSFPLRGRPDANRRYCSQKCAKRANAKRTMDWMHERPDIMQKYNKNRLAKNPSVWRKKARTERQETIRLLGKGCIVCNVINPNWLHIDYVPTTRGKPYRHPRHLNFIRKHLNDFRLLCANHHYELTLTGAIKGTKIKQ